MTLQTRTVALADLELDVDINARRHRTEGIEELKASIRELFWAVAGGGPDLAADGLGEHHPQGKARSFMAAPTRISRDSMDRDAIRP